jgi:hypothetical protein
MQTAGARVLQEDDQQDLSREAVLLQWERKIEAAESRPRRFERESADEGTVEDLHPTEDTTHLGRRRFERHSSPADTALAEPPAERRTITITGQPTPARRRRSVIDSQVAQPDRIALWAFLLGLFLVAVAAGTAHA